MSELLSYWWVFVGFLISILAPLWLILEKLFFRPCEVMDMYNRAAAEARLDSAIIPDHFIRNDEVGDIMRHRNSMLETLIEQISALQAGEVELALANERLERYVTELEAGRRLARFQMEMHTVKEAGDEVVAVLQEALDATQVVLYRATEETGVDPEPLATAGLMVPAQTETSDQQPATPDTAAHDAGDLITRGFRGGQALVEGSRAVSPFRYRDEIHRRRVA